MAPFLTNDKEFNALTFEKMNQIVSKNPMLWLGQEILKGLSKKNQEDWINVIKLTKDTKLESNITKYLRRVAKKVFLSMFHVLSIKMF